MKKTLKNSKVIGFFSLPSLMMAEHNPSAYSDAMRVAPEQSGVCSHCGTGILHHVVIQDECGTTRFIGSDCALKVGVSPESVRYRMTSDQIAERDEKRAAEHQEWQRKRDLEEDNRLAVKAARREKVGGLVDMLRNLGGEFYSSLADQLENQPLSSRQAEYVAKATSATGRRNKKNAAAFDAVWDLCTE